ncbi:MAG TPA: tRNA (cytidine(34)-2'-O)-methyltransferase [Chthoniobacterales bacterium]|nr:tRNA (cytidine(34)-2'-O)-methyltransferase [Chthoniobacterales bacterium]
MFNLVLVEPEIPPNTGNVGRLALATGSTLHLVQPLGFSIDDQQLRRAGMDYWKNVNVKLWENFEQFELKIEPSARRFFFSTKVEKPYWDIRFSRKDYLIFGRETKGLPASLLARHAEDAFRIPMLPEARSLNLATAVAIVLFEGMRQLSAVDLAN